MCQLALVWKNNGSTLLDKWLAATTEFGSVIIVLFNFVIYVLKTANTVYVQDSYKTVLTTTLMCKKFTHSFSLLLESYFMQQKGQIHSN